MSANRCVPSIMAFGKLTVIEVPVTFPWAVWTIRTVAYLLLLTIVYFTAPEEITDTSAIPFVR